MPLESRVFVKTAMVALVITVLWGAAMSFAEATGRNAEALFPLEHAHVAFVGWMMNAIFGFALWLLPANRLRFPKTQGRYPLWGPWVIYAFLNGGLALRLVSEPILASGMAARVLLALSAALQVAAVLLFTAIAWLRTRGASRPSSRAS